MRWLLRLGPLLGLALAIVAQVILCWGEEHRWAGLAWYAVAGVIFVASVARWPRPFPWRRVGRNIPWTTVSLLAAGGMMGCAAYLAHVMPWERGNYEVAGLLWGMSIGLSLLTFLRVPLSEAGIRREGREVALVAVLFLVGLALRLIGLAQFPDLMSGDEGSMALEADRILSGDLINPFSTGWLSHANLFFYLQAAVLGALGWNLFALRLTAALLGAWGVVAVYLLARGVLGREGAWIAGGLAAGWGLLVHFSRLALNNSADLLFGAAVMAFLQRGLVRGRRGYFAASGLALGLSLYFYHGTRLLVPLVVVTVVLAGARRLRRRWRGLLILAFVALVVAGPLLAHFVRHPDQFLARRDTIGLFRSGQLEKEQAWTGKSRAWLLWNHLGRAAYAFIHTRDVGFFYQPDTPLLHVLSGALFVLGVGLAVWGWRQPRHQVLLLWVGMTVLFGGFLLKSPPHYQRYMIAAPAVCLLVAGAGVTALRRLARAWGWPRPVRRGLAAGLGVALLAINAGYYFGDYVPGGSFHFDRNTETADRTARAMVELGPEYHTYFFGTSGMRLGGFNCVRFLARDRVWMDVEELSPGDWRFVDREAGAFFVFRPERAGEVALVEEAFPGGVRQEVMARNGDLLYVAYVLPPEAMPAAPVEREGNTQ